MKRLITFAAVTSLVMFIAGSQVAWADGYTLSFLRYPDGTYTNANGINNSGVIVGSTPLGGFLYQDGVFAPFSEPGATGTVPTAISNNGLIVGYSSLGTFLYNGTFTPLTFAGHTTVPHGVNSSGVIVGSDGNGFWFDGTNFTLIPIPGAIFTEAYGINDLGQVVGLYNSATEQDGFVYDINTGTFQDIAVPGASQTQAYGINNLGQIVGAYGDSSGFHGFVYADGVFTTLDGVPVLADHGNTFLVEINDSGEIIGDVTDSGMGGSFLATPVPEPWSLSFVGTGIMIVVGIVRRGDLRSRRHGE